MSYGTSRKEDGRDLQNCAGVAFAAQGAIDSGEAGRDLQNCAGVTFAAQGAIDGRKAGGPAASATAEEAREKDNEGKSGMHPADEEVVLLVREGHADMMDYLLEKYKPLVKSRAANKFLKGGDPDDLIQEGMIGLYKAIRDYDSANERGASFFTFARLCIDRQLFRAIEATQRQKRSALNDAVSYEDEEFEKYSVSDEEDPEQIFLDQENADETASRILDVLSRTEKVVFNLMLRGYSYREIADIMDRSPKSIDNAIQRIRKKTAAVRKEA